MGWRDNPVIFLTEKMWVYSEGNRKNVVLFIILTIIANLISFIEPFIVALFLNTLQLEGVHQGNIAKLIGIASLFFFVWFAMRIFHAPARVLEINNSFIVRANYKEYLVEGTLGLDANWHTNNHSGQTIDKIEKATQALHGFASEFYILIELVLKIIASIVIITYFNLNAMFLILFIMTLSFFTVMKFDSRLKHRYIKLNKAENDIAQKIYDVISNISTVLILRIEKLVQNDIVKKILQPQKFFNKTNLIQEAKWSIVSFLSAFLTFGVLTLYILDVYWTGDALLIGSIYIIYGYLGRITDVFFRFAGRWSRLVVQRARVQNVESVSDHFKPKPKIKSIKIDKAWNEMRLQNLNFSYHNEEEHADLHLKSVNITIKRNEKIAFIGESGSGKTTFLKLLRGLYTPKTLDLYLDERKIKGLDTIKSNIALIPQDPELFATTIRSNITMGLTHSEKEIKEFTDMAMFTKVVQRLPRKLNSNIMEKGVNLSGGEKQRLALARGLMAVKSKAVVLLDEPTSSVDSKNEMEIYKNIFKKYKNKTIISSIHRLHLLRMFDTIYMFEKGNIVGYGSFNQLLKSNKKFNKLWEKYNKQKKK